MIEDLSGRWWGLLTNEMKRRRSVPKIVKVMDVIEETSLVKTLFLDMSVSAWPGQFVMLWVPGVGEIPMSVASLRGGLQITVQKVGSITETIHQLKQGGSLGVRGPFGNGYDLKCSKPLLVAGGLGAAPLRLALEVLVAMGKAVTIILGARTANELLFHELFIKLGAEVKVTTDDGSEGHHGYVTDLASSLLEKGQFDQILTCGPEPMIVKLVEMGQSHGVGIQASLERYMKCGMGICDSCGMGGLQVCKDGPVFSGVELANNPDFGLPHRDASGLRRQ